MAKKIILAILLLFITSGASSLHSQISPEIFTIKGVKIYAESSNLYEAKLQAMEEGYSIALRKLLEKLMPFNHYWKIANINQDIIEKSILWYQLYDERITSTSYMATLDVELNSNEIFAILNTTGTIYAFTQPDKMLLIPVLFSQGEYSIWARDDWSTTWEKMPSSIGLLEIEQAIGDLDDLQNIDLNAALQADFNNLDALSQQYETQNIMLINCSDYQRLVCDMRLLLPNKMYKRYYKSTGSDEAFCISTEIALDMLYNFDATWKGEELLQDTTLDQYTFVLNFNGAKQLHSIKEMLKSLGVSSIKQLKSTANSSTVQLMLPYTIGELYSKMPAPFTMQYNNGLYHIVSIE